MLRHTPRSTRNDTLCPYTTLCRSSASKRLNQRLDTIPNEIGTGVLSFALLSAAFAHAAQAPVAQLDRALPSEGCTPPSRQGRSEEHTSELQSLMRISYAVFCLKKKKKHTNNKLNKRHTHRHHNNAIHINKTHERTKYE